MELIEIMSWKSISDSVIVRRIKGLIGSKCKLHDGSQ